MKTALADAQGEFSGSGSTTGIDNLPVWVFMFENQPQPQSGLFYLALVSGTGPSWRVQNNGTANIDTATADIFRFGRPAGNGVIGLNVAPFPEPGLSLVAVCAGLLTFRRSGSRAER